MINLKIEVECKDCGFIHEVWLEMELSGENRIVAKVNPCEECTGKAWNEGNEAAVAQTKKRRR